MGPTQGAQFEQNFQATRNNTNLSRNNHLSPYSHTINNNTSSNTSNNSQDIPDLGILILYIYIQ